MRGIVVAVVQQINGQRFDGPFGQLFGDFAVIIIAIAKDRPANCCSVLELLLLLLLLGMTGVTLKLLVLLRRPCISIDTPYSLPRGRFS